MGVFIEVFLDQVTLRRFMLYFTFLALMLFPKLLQSSSTSVCDNIGQEIDSLSILASEYHNWAVRHYSIPEKLDSVILMTKKALVIREKLWKDNPNIDLGKSYHNLGAFLKRKGNFGDAKKYLKEAVSVFTTLEHDRVLRSLLELGRIYKQEGDFLSAEDYFKSVIKIAQDRGNDQKIRDAVINLGSTYVDAFRDTIAIDHLEKYIDYFDVTNKDGKQFIGMYYNNLASAYLRNNIYDKAIITYQNASLFDTANYKDQAKIYTNLAIAFRMKKQFKNCYNALERGKELAYRTGDLEQMSFSHVGFAKYHEFRSEHRSALSEHQKAIVLLIPSFKPTDDFSNPTPEDLKLVINKIFLLTYLTEKVKMIIALGKEKYKKEILELFRLGDILIDDMRGDHFIDGTKLYWRSVAFPFYEKALMYCHGEKAYEDAFYFFEKSKSVLLLEGYSFNEAISQTSDHDKERYQKLKNLLNQSKKIKNLDSVDDMVNSQRSFETFIDSLSITYPHLFKKYKEQVLLSLSDFQSEFANDSATIYIHYFYGKDSVYALGIENKEFSLLNLGETQKIDSLISNVKQFFHHASQIDNDFNSYKRVSHELYKELLSPLIQDRHKEVVILPDGLLASVPFESLISFFDEAQEIKYVIQDRLIRYSFSGSILSNMKDSNHRGSYDVVTFVPFNTKENSQGANFSGVLEKDFKNAKKNGLNVKQFNGQTATKETLFSFNERLPILHFSSHGFVDKDKDPEILLANSSFSLSELYTSSLPSDMVFLSACRTNLGENSYGEGIQSMARGFTFAGANSVVSSLWNVIADPNSKIVRQFYENLSIGQTKHLALHNAKLSYLEDPDIPLFEKSPYYWAGLVYYGESDHILKPERKPRGTNVFIYISVLVLLLGSFFGFRYYQRSM